MLEFHLENLKRLLDLREKALADMNFMLAQYYDSALSGCIYYMFDCYLEKKEM